MRFPGIPEISLRHRLPLLTTWTGGVGLVLGCLSLLVYDMRMGRETDWLASSIK